MDTFSPAMDTPEVGSRTAFVCRNPPRPPANHESAARATLAIAGHATATGQRTGVRGGNAHATQQSCWVPETFRRVRDRYTNALGAAAARMGMAQACTTPTACRAKGRETHDLVGVGVAEVGLLGLRLNADRVGDVAQRVGDALLRPVARSQVAAGDVAQSAREGARRCCVRVPLLARAHLAPGELVPPKNRHDGKQPAHTNKQLGEGEAATCTRDGCCLASQRHGACGCTPRRALHVHIHAVSAPWGFGSWVVLKSTRTLGERGAVLGARPRSRRPTLAQTPAAVAEAHTSPDSDPAAGGVGRPGIMVLPARP